MSGIGRWSLGIGAVLLPVSVLCVVLGAVSAGVITGIFGLLAVGIAGYDALYEWLGRVQLRRRAARAREGRRPEAF
jgi:hypothetical protein